MVKKNYQLNRNKKFVDKAQQCFAFTPQAKGEGDEIESRLPFNIFSTNM